MSPRGARRLGTARLGAVAALALALLTACGIPVLTGPPAPPPASGPPAPAGPAAPSGPAAPEQPGPLAAYLLAATELVLVDEGGRELARIPLADAIGVRDALAELNGPPTVEGLGPGCNDLEWAYWPSPTGGSSFVAYDPAALGAAVVSIKDAGMRVRPVAGPGFGEQSAPFVAGLGADRVGPTGAYLYDVAPGPGSGGSLYGGVAFVDEHGVVDALAAPSAPAPTGMC